MQGAAHRVPLCHANFPVWCRSQGEKVLENTGSCGYAGISPSELDAFHDAIKLNQIDQVRKFLDKYPQALYIKGSGKRTALYIAAFYGHHAIIQLMLQRGADKNMSSGGLRPMDIVAFGQRNPTNRMECLQSLGAFREPHVIIWSKDVLVNHEFRAELCRFQVHFSEAVGDFIGEDIEVKGPAKMEKFKALQKDSYSLILRIHGEGVITLHVPSNVTVRYRCNKSTAPNVYNTASEVFKFIARHTKS